MRKSTTRKSRVRAKLKARSLKPRISVFVSNTHIYAQIIDDVKGVTLAAARDTEAKASGKKVEVAQEVGQLLAKKAKEKGITDVKFDRGDKKYHGRIKALADGAREGGLTF
jgi:large subunit ribosomal protein L18